MKILTAPTEDFIKGQRTQITAAVSAGSGVSIPVQNSGGYNVHDYIVLGVEGSSTAELVQISAIADATHITATIALGHFADEPVVQYAFNDRKFYGATVSGGSYTELTSYGSPAHIGVDQPEGTTIEYTGSEGYLYFKSTYWNSYTSTESNIADANEVLADESVRYCSLFDIRKQAGLTLNSYVDDGRVESKRKQAENEINSYLIDRYVLPLLNSESASEIPFLITRCAILLAGGYLDYEEFMGEGQGVKWLGEARGILGRIQVGKQRLIDVSGGEFQTQAQTNIIRGSTQDRPPMFRRGQKF